MPMSRRLTHVATKPRWTRQQEDFMDCADCSFDALSSHRLWLHTEVLETLERLWLHRIRDEMAPVSPPEARNGSNIDKDHPCRIRSNSALLAFTAADRHGSPR